MGHAWLLCVRLALSLLNSSESDAALCRCMKLAPGYQPAGIFLSAVLILPKPSSVTAFPLGLEILIDSN